MTNIEYLVTAYTIAVTILEESQCNGIQIQNFLKGDKNKYLSFFEEDLGIKATKCEALPL